MNLGFGAIVGTNKLYNQTNQDPSSAIEIYQKIVCSLFNKAKTYTSQSDAFIIAAKEDQNIRKSFYEMLANKLSTYVGGNTVEKIIHKSGALAYIVFITNYNDEDKNDIINYLKNI